MPLNKQLPIVQFLYIVDLQLVIMASFKINPLNVNVPILVHRQFMTEMQMNQFWYIPF